MVCEVLQRLAIEKFHGDEGVAFMFGDFIDGTNVWMIERGSGLGFTLEAAESLGVRRESFGKEFQGDETVKLGVLGLIYNTHASTTELLDDLVVRNGLANHGLRLAQC
jgi:hypothetical protein